MLPNVRKMALPLSAPRPNTHYLVETETNPEQEQHNE